jgi:adenylate cyclase
MASVLQVQVLDRHQEVYNRNFSGSVELGRQNDGREDLYAARQVKTGAWRVVIAPLDEDTISRQHAYLEPLAGSRVRLTNKSGKVPIRLADGTELSAGRSVELELPAVLGLGRRTVQVQAGDRAPQPEVRSLLRSSLMAPGQLSMVAASRFPTLTSADSVDLENLLSWLQTTMGVLHSAATSTDFFQKAAAAVVEMVGCDTGRVLLLRDGPFAPPAPAEDARKTATAGAPAAEGPWVVAAQFTGPHVTPAMTWRPSQQVLSRVLSEKRTFWLQPEPGDLGAAESLLGVEVVVAAPILDREGEVIGALYGDCRGDPLGKLRLNEVEARLVELLASGVATGLARMEQEKAAVEAEVRFSQFFTRELAQQLAVQKDLLDGQEREVSLLFADIRRFSHLSEHLGPVGTVQMIGDIMGRLSDCVLAHHGVLVDYIGDELIAMWGAPADQPDHARLACRAALDMLRVLGPFNAAWQGRLPEPLDLGIGVNSGKAWVGNMGSRHKFKYGPLGPTVNLASRVQGATKFLRSRLLITEHTQKHLGDEFPTRRLGKVRVVNVPTPIDLYEVVGEHTPEWLDLKARYEEALAEFEKGEYRRASRVLGGLLGQHAEDGPALVMCWRALQNRVEPNDRFDPVWELPGK